MKKKVVQSSSSSSVSGSPKKTMKVMKVKKGSKSVVAMASKWGKLENSDSDAESAKLCELLIHFLIALCTFCIN